MENTLAYFYSINDVEKSFIMLTVDAGDIGSLEIIVYLKILAINGIENTLAYFSAASMTHKKNYIVDADTRSTESRDIFVYLKNERAKGSSLFFCSIFDIKKFYNIGCRCLDPFEILKNWFTFLGMNGRENALAYFCNMNDLEKSFIMSSVDAGGIGRLEIIVYFNCFPFFSLCLLFLWCHDTQHNDTHPNDAQNK
jgi:hypothetical protein